MAATVTPAQPNHIEAQCVAKGMRMTEQRRCSIRRRSRVRQRTGGERYEQLRESHHDHRINLRTGEVVEFESVEIERLQAEVARRLGYRLVDHRLELYAVPLDDKPKG